MAKFLAKVVDVETETVTFSLANGLKLVLGLADLSDAMIRRLALHGMSQKVGDSAAGCSKAEDYRGAFNVMQAVIDSLIAEVWSTRTSGMGDLVEALVTVQNMDEDEARELVDAMDEETTKAVLAHPAIKAEIKKQQARRAAEAAKAAADSAPDLAALLRKA